MINKKSDKYYSGNREDMLAFIPPNSKRILEVGCGEGCFGLRLKQQYNSEVWGIEYNKEAAKKAGDKLDKILTGDVNVLLADLPNSYFDCIVFNDVLEHLIDPYLVLEKIKDKLTENGQIVASIPNIRYIAIIRDLIINKDWKYENSGVLDRTHLRFFTQKSIIRMFESACYKIIKIKGITANNNLKFNIFNFITLGFFSDCRFVQFACVVTKNRNLMR